MQLTLRALRIFVASVLSYIGQLERPPQDLEQAETQAMRRLAPGPHAWVSLGAMKDLCNLGFPVQWVPLRESWTAAKARVARWEAGGRLRIRARAAALRALACGGGGAALDQLALAKRIRDDSFVLKLAAAEREVAAARSEDVRAAWRRRVGWQRMATRALLGPSSGAALAHLDDRVRRWPVGMLPGHRVARARRTLERTGRSCQPRVWAAAIRTMFDGWSTAARFGQTGPCQFCGQGVDGLRHLAFCGVARHLREEVAGLGAPGRGHELELLLGLLGDTDEEGTRKWAVHNYVMYRLHGLLRHGVVRRDDLPGAYVELARTAVWTEGLED